MKEESCVYCPIETTKYSGQKRSTYSTLYRKKTLPILRNRRAIRRAKPEVAEGLKADCKSRQFPEGNWGKIKQSYYDGLFFPILHYGKEYFVSPKRASKKSAKTADFIIILPH